VIAAGLGEFINQNREIVARRVVRGALLGAAFLGAALFGARSASADIGYLVDEPIGVGSVVGTLTTDGHTGILSSSDFLAWNLTLNGVGASSTITSSDPTAAIELVGSEVVATPTKITFDFSGSAICSFGTGYFRPCTIGAAGQAPRRLASRVKL
jgi:hypothetical protein